MLAWFPSRSRYQEAGPGPNPNAQDLLPLTP